MERNLFINNFKNVLLFRFVLYLIINLKNLICISKNYFVSLMYLFSPTSKKQNNYIKTIDCVKNCNNDFHNRKQYDYWGQFIDIENY